MTFISKNKFLIQRLVFFKLLYNIKYMYHTIPSYQAYDFDIFRAIYLHFLMNLDIDMATVAEILPDGWPKCCLSFIVNNMVTDDLATVKSRSQGNKSHRIDTVFPIIICTSIHDYFTQTLHERHGLWNHCCFDCFATVCSAKEQRYALLAFVSGIHQWLVDSPQKRPVMWKEFPCHDVIKQIYLIQ